MLTIRRTRVFHGPSIWALVPVIMLEVDIGDLEARLCHETPIFFERLIELVPSLSDHGRVVNQPEGGLRRLLLDRLCLALQNLAGGPGTGDHTHFAGSEVTYAQTERTDEYGVYTVVYEYEHEEVGRAAGLLAVRLLNHLIFKSESTFNFNRELEETLVPRARHHAYAWATGTFAAAAQRRGIPVQRLLGRTNIVQLGTGACQRRISGMLTSETALLGRNLAGDKGHTARLLREAGLPVPDSAMVRDVDGAARAAANIGYPVVVKPLNANHGRGIAIDVRDEAEVREVFPVAARESRTGQVIVECFIPGKDYRILVINNRVVAVAERILAHVIGDGVHTVAELIETTNADPHRGFDPDKTLKPIIVDAETIVLLAKQELGPDDIPEKGRVVRLKRICSRDFGCITIDRTDEIHPDNVEIACQAAMVIGLDIAGIDFITPDIAHSACEQGGAINEVNAQPDVRMHTLYSEGTPRDVGIAVIDMLFPPGRPSRVPIVAVTGTNGKTTTTRLIAHVMATAGKRVGMTTSDGISIDATKLMGGDCTGPDDARKVLRNPAVDCAVLETACGRILRDGLGFDVCDVALVTNVAADDLGIHGIATAADMAKVKAVLPRSVVPEGASVLNADNPYTVEMAQVARGEILYFSLDEQNPVVHDHLQQGGRAVVLRHTTAGEMLTLLADQEETGLLLVEEIPAIMDGGSRVNIADALAAAAATVAQQVPLETIRTALRSFATTFV